MLSGIADCNFSALQSMDDSGSTKTLFYTMEAPMKLPAPLDEYIRFSYIRDRMVIINQLSTHPPYFMRNLERIVKKTIGLQSKNCTPC